MGSFVPSNVSTCDILNFAGRGKCSTPTVNEHLVCCTKAPMEIGARPFTASFMWLISCWMSLNLYSHDLPLSPADKIGAHCLCCFCHASPRCDPLCGVGKNHALWCG